MRNGMVVPFALGMVILSGIVLFGGSIADQVLMKNRYFQIKEFTEKSALAAANYYHNVPDSEIAQNKTLLLMQSNPLYEDIQDEIEFLWQTDEEEEVTVSVHHAEFHPFWLRMFGMDVVNMNDINSSAKLIVNDEAVSEKTKNFLPIAINTQEVEIGENYTFTFAPLECSDIRCCDFNAGFSASGSFGGFGGGFDFSMSCNSFNIGGSWGGPFGFSGGMTIGFGSDSCSQGFPWFPSMSFSSSMNWDPDNKNVFYAVDLEADGNLQNGVSHNAHWKQMIAGTRETPEASYSAYINLLKMMSNMRFLCADVGDNKETAQLQQAVNAFKKMTGKTFDIALVDDKAEISGFITVRLDHVDSKNGQNGYLKIGVNVVANQNNKEVKLVD